MKRSVVFAAGLAVLSTPALATKARMAALGHNGEIGVAHIEDNRRIFANPALVNRMNNYVTIELGDGPISTPRAEGGFFKDAGSIAWGLYMNNRAGDQTGISATQADRTGFLSRTNSLDAFVAGDAGVEWGVRFGFGMGQNDEGALKRKQSNMSVSAGVAVGDLQGFGTFDISDKSDGRTGGVSGDSWKAKLGMHLGVNYNLSGWVLSAEYMNYGAERKLTGETKSTASTNTILVGAGKVWDISKESRFIADARFLRTALSEKPAAGTKTDTTTTNLPVTVGFEIDATSWLVLRGSIVQNVFLSTTEVKTATKTKTTTDSTATAAGATLNFGKLRVDGTVATSGGTLRLDSLLSQASLSYMF